MRLDIPRTLATFGVFSSLVSCSTDRAIAPSYLAATAPGFTFSDATHNGNQHFYFLAPLVQQPTFSGVADGGSTQPMVDILENGSKIGSLAALLSSDGQFYQADWHTDLFTLDPAKTYRLNVAVGGVVLGFADVDVVSNGSELKNVNTNELVPLKDGRTLPIKFRIERGALDCNCWTLAPDMPTPRSGLAVAGLNGVVYVLGGSDGAPAGATVEAFNIATSTWSTRASMPTARENFGAVGVNGRIYAIGGAGSHPCICDANLLNVVEAYDPSTDTWSTLAPMPTPRAFLGVAAIGDVIYAVGGYNRVVTSLGYQQTNIVEAYDTRTGIWSSKAPLPSPQIAMGVAVVDGILYSIGGFTESIGSFAPVFAYDPASDTWTEKRSMATFRYSFAAQSIDGVIYAPGGFNTISGFWSTVEAYSPATDSWGFKPPMHFARGGYGGVAINRRLYVVGGFPVTSSVEFYRP